MLCSLLINSFFLHLLLDSINGVGWKFTTIANAHSIESGEIVSF